jgi:hypothetical protein
LPPASPVIESPRTWPDASLARASAGYPQEVLSRGVSANPQEMARFSRKANLFRSKVLHQDL